MSLNSHHAECAHPVGNTYGTVFANAVVFPDEDRHIQTGSVTSGSVSFVGMISQTQAWRIENVFAKNAF
jgi:hypothetical protein